jgi:hypothetical protein
MEALEAAELRFMYGWRAAFRLSIDKRTGPADPRYDFFASPGFGVRENQRSVWESTPARHRAIQALATAYSHCHSDARPYVWAMAGVPESRVLSSKTSGRVFCPSWVLSDSLHYDASVVVDNAIAPRYRAAIRNGRDSAIQLFERGAREFPGSAWVIGQLVRLLVDQRELGRALAAAQGCRAAPVWCAQLLGYVHAERGNWVRADSAFETAARAMSPPERCAWNDASVLLDSLAVATYLAVPCAGRDSVNAILWWLSDPMYTEPGNERRAVHYARRIGIALRSGLLYDERYDWRPIAGRDGMTEMIERYGWPAYSYWAYGFLASAVDLAMARFDSTHHIAYTTFEYTGGRLQTVPVWRAIADPLKSASGDWAISDPRKPVPRVTYRDDRVSREFVQVVSKVSEWWPRQHFAPSAPLAQIPDGQTAFLRRDANVIFATANPIAPGDFGSTRRSISGTLMITSQPDDVRVVANARGVVGAPLVLFGPIESRPTLAAVEFPAVSATGPAGGRTRFSVAPPAPLSSMRSGEFAISDLVVLTPPSAGDQYPAETERVLPFMAGSTTFARGRRVGVYWETYGFAPDDSVEFAVWIERYTAQGLLRRFGIALNVATDRNTPVAQSWTETRLGRNANVIPGRVPVIGRSIVLDASALTPGEYWLDVVARKPGSEPVRSRRSIVITER